MNLFQAITSALDNSLAKDPTAGKLPLCFLWLLRYFRIEDLLEIFVWRSVVNFTLVCT